MWYTCQAQIRTEGERKTATLMTDADSRQAAEEKLIKLHGKRFFNHQFTLRIVDIDLSTVKPSIAHFIIQKVA